MSAESVSQFLEAVTTDEQLQERLAQVIESAESGGENADREGVAELAKEYNYDFTAEELWQEIRKRQEQAKAGQSTGELSDEELEAVAGGGEIWITTLFTATATAITALIPKIKW